MFCIFAPCSTMNARSNIRKKVEKSIKTSGI
nr:MAG TPA: hypothetical protein [Caudoviricetes sp.]